MSAKGHSLIELIFKIVDLYIKNVKYLHQFSVQKIEYCIHIDRFLFTFL